MFLRVVAGFPGFSELIDQAVKAEAEYGCHHHSFQAEDRHIRFSDVKAAVGPDHAEMHQEESSHCYRQERQNVYLDLHNGYILGEQQRFFIRNIADRRP